MLWTPRAAPAGEAFHNATGVPSSTSGALVTAPGSSANTWTSWVGVATAAQLPNGSGGMSISQSGPFISSISESWLGQIGVDPAGGTSYTPIVTWMVGPCVGNTLRGGLRYYPIATPPGGSVAIRLRRSSTSATSSTSYYIFRFDGRTGGIISTQYSDGVGVTEATSQGTNFTPGNATWGSYVALGTTTRPLCWWQLSWSVKNATQTTEYTLIELSYGDGSTKIPIFRERHLGHTGEYVQSLEEIGRSPGAYCPVPVGATLYVRGLCQNVPDTGYNALATGFGGG